MAHRNRARRRKEQEQRLKRKRDRLRKYLDFNYVTDPMVLSEAALECEKTVKWKQSAQNFMLTRIKNCIELSDELREGKYHKSPAYHFKICERGKTRLISGVHFRDRVVQKSYCEHFLIPIMLDGIIYDNTASQKGKGPDFARERFSLHMTRALNAYGRNGWFVYYDFKSYFANIPNDGAMRMIEDAVAPLVVTHDDAINAERLLDLGRVFICEEDGLGIGNQTSQTMAIAYASPIDHALREVCRLKYSGRYMDDGYAFCRNKTEALITLGVIDTYAHRIGLTLQTKKTGIEPIMHPHLFLKSLYSYRQDGSVQSQVARTTVRNYKRHYRGIARCVARGDLPISVLEASEGAWPGIAQRATDPTAVNNEIQRFFTEVRRQYRIETNATIEPGRR